MPLEDVTFQLGEVMSVDTDKKTINVQSRLDGSVIPNIQLEPSIHQQYVPVVGQQVMLFRVGEYFTGVLAYLGSRPFTRPLLSGETLIEGSGGGKVFVDHSGDVMLSDKLLSNVLEILSSVGFQVTGDALSLEIKGIAKVTIMDDAVEVTKVTAGGMLPTAKVTIKDGEVVVDALSVKVGKAPTIGAAVVSLSNVPGDYSFDLITGRPIPGSTQVKANP